MLREPRTPEPRAAPSPRRPPAASPGGLLALQSLAGNLAVSRLVGKAPLRRGSKGPEVADLQRRLGIKDDGDFGGNTEKAVKAFQRGRGLEPDGVVGKDTRAALDALGSPPPFKPAPPIPGPVPESGPPGTPFGPASLPPATSAQDLPAFRAARADLGKFLAQDHYIAKKFKPSSNIGGFNVDYSPSTGVITAHFIVNFEFKDGKDVHKVFRWPDGRVTRLPFPVPEGLDPRTISQPDDETTKVPWDEPRKEKFRRAFREQVQDTWNNAAFTFHCHRDWWEHLKAHARVVVTDRTGVTPTPPDIGSLYTVQVTAGANPDPSGPERSNLGVELLSLYEEDGDTSGGRNVLGHESGHMLGLGDEYFDNMKIKPGRAQHSDLVEKEFGHPVDRQDSKTTTKDPRQSLMLTDFGTVHPELSVTLLEALVKVTGQEWHTRSKPPRPVPPGGR